MENISDKELYRRARFYGRNALLWRRKFIGLLPEIERRRIYEKKGYESIFVFAKKLAGLSEDQVRRALNLEKRFADKPVLNRLLTNGEVSINKLARVASIATPENEEELAEKVKMLPQSAIETLVRDENGLNKPKNEVKSVRAHSLELSKEVTEKLLELQRKGIDINEVLLDLLQKREEEIQKEKIEIAAELVQTESRYIPAKVRRIIQKEHGGKCSIRTCNKPAKQLHHTQTFSLSCLHDPRYLAPLCKDHHAIAHSINLKVQEKRQELLL